MNQNDRMNKATKIIAHGSVQHDYLNKETAKVVDDLINKANQAYLAGGPEAPIIAMAEAREKYEQKMTKKTESYTRTLRQKDNTLKLAGFINASILIYFILIFGVLIALSLIIFQF